MSTSKKPETAFRNAAEFRKEFIAVNSDSNESVRLFTIRAAKYAQASGMSVRALKKELEGARDGIIKREDAQEFVLAAQIYNLPASAGVASWIAKNPRNVFVVAQRVRKSVGTDKAAKAIADTAKLTVTEVKKDKKGKEVRVTRPLNVEEWKESFPLPKSESSSKAATLDDIIKAFAERLSAYEGPRDVTPETAKLVEQIGESLATLNVVKPKPVGKPKPKAKAA